MADDEAEGQERTDGDEQEQTPEAERDGGGGGLPRRRLVALAGLTLGAFVVSGLIALSRGGHFQRRPLCGLRGVPGLGRLIAPPPSEQEDAPEPVPNVAAVHPMPATEISELIQELQASRASYQTRHEELGKQEERLRALQLDLARERDRLDELMARLGERRGALVVERGKLDADIVVARSEERKRLTQLARIYEAQEAAAAANELAALDKSSSEGLAVKILATMTEKKAAPIFDAMPPETAAALKTRLLKLRFEADTNKAEETS